MYSPSSLVMDQRSPTYPSRAYGFGKGHQHQQATFNSCSNLSLSSCVSGSETTFNGIDSSSSREEHSRIGRKLTYDSTTSLNSTPSLSSFDPGWRLYLSFGILSIVGLAASLDATSISPALPVSFSTVVNHTFLNITDRLSHRLSTALPLQLSGQAPPFALLQLFFSPSMPHFLPYLAGSHFSLLHWSSSQLVQ
jgi:hypothetical protein